MYLEKAVFPTNSREMDYLWTSHQVNLTYNTSVYPFKTLSEKGLTTLELAPLTILYGGNGSGKTTALNLLAEKVRAARVSIFNQTVFYPEYLEMMAVSLSNERPDICRMIASDDVFDYLLNLRHINQGLDQKRHQLAEEYTKKKYAQFQMQTIEDYETLKRVNDTRRKTQSQFVNGETTENVPTYSNGESAYKYFTETITENGLYILDEPENSLAPQLQIQLGQFIEEAVRFYRCQIIMATHSPFLLSMKGATVYNLDTSPVRTKSWVELANVRTTYDFFQKHAQLFK